MVFLAKLSHQRLSGKKPLDVLNLPGDGRRRQALEKLLSVALRDYSRVENGEGAAVGRAADQSSESLFQSDDRRRDRVTVEAVSAVIVDVTLPRADHRVGRHGERKLINDHARERLAP